MSSARGLPPKASGPTIDFETELNAAQLAAVRHGEGPQLVIAGAGSGKTRAITYRVAWLVRERGVDPAQIAAVTFTNKAAAEMRDRIEELLGIYPLRAFVGTFHRFSLRLLRIYGQKVGLPRDFAILDTSDQISLIKRSMKQAGVPKDAFRPQAVLGAISAAKNQLIGPARYDREADDFFSRKVAKVYQQYQAALREAGAVDFDDMIRLAVELLRNQAPIRRRIQQRYRYLLVDEFQDTNHAQMCLIEEVCGATGQLTAVGDEDQGIYRWRGAELANILEFERSFEGTTVRKLEQNYRSTQTILDASGALVAHNENRRGKELWTEKGEGELLLLFRGRDEQDEARWICNTLKSLEGEHGFTRMAVLVRTNAQSRAIEDAFLRNGVPYTLVAGVRFYERAEIKDLVAYLRLIRNPEDRLSFDRVLNRPARGIGKSTQNRLAQVAERNGRSPWQILGDEEITSSAFSSRAQSALRRFRHLVEELRLLAESTPLPALLRHVLEATDFRAQYDDSNEDDQGRLENIQELLSSAQEFVEKNAFESDADDLLPAFLDHVALTSDTDSLGGPGVSLMTLHSAKGLEFDVVVLAGLEDGLLPHFNSRSHPDDLEEERRLLYVGMTRARQRLLLTTCRRRRIAGQYQDQEESRFLSEIPDRFLVAEQSPELFAEPPRYDRAPSFGGSPDLFSTAEDSVGDDAGGKNPSGSQTRDVFAFFGKEAPASSAVVSSAGTTAESSGGASGHRTRPFQPRALERDPVRRGARVRHSKLGMGKVMQIEGSGEDARLIVYFEGVGRRKLIVKYANLEIL
ncbi:MAG: UvrD-helicase domain-containing protein [Holophagales bacterium]|nr:UvrD-helicase domain-containing protein [Holophagales bacterium]